MQDPLVSIVYLILTTVGTVLLLRPWPRFMELRYGPGSLDRAFSSWGREGRDVISRWPRDLLLPDRDPVLEAARRRALISWALLLVWLVVAAMLAAPIADLFSDRRAANLWLTVAWSGSLVGVCLWQLRLGPARWLPRRVAVLTGFVATFLAVVTLLSFGGELT
jgi:hypothetical protein